MSLNHARLPIPPYGQIYKIAVTRLELARFSAIDFESTSYSEFRHTAKMHQERLELS